MRLSSVDNINASRSSYFKQWLGSRYNLHHFWDIISKTFSETTGIHEVSLEVNHHQSNFSASHSKWIWLGIDNFFMRLNAVRLATTRTGCSFKRYLRIEAALNIQFASTGASIFIKVWKGRISAIFLRQFTYAHTTFIIPKWSRITTFLASIESIASTSTIFTVPIWIAAKAITWRAIALTITSFWIKRRSWSQAATIIWVNPRFACATTLIVVKSEVFALTGI